VPPKEGSFAQDSFKRKWAPSVKYAPGACKTNASGDVRPFGTYRAQRRIPDDIDETKVATQGENAFAALARERGVSIPTIEYAKCQTAQTTVDYAINAMREPIDRSFLSTPQWTQAIELAYHALRPALVSSPDDFLSSSDEIKAELNMTKHAGHYASIQGCQNTGEWVSMAEARHGTLLEHVFHHFARSFYPCVYKSHMKIEWVPKVKILTRKQRMYLVQNKEMVVSHKHFFSKQSKRLRKYREIAHGQTYFFGNVHALSIGMRGSQVQSEDDEFWDKRFVFMRSIYQMRLRALRESKVELSAEQERVLLYVCQNMYDIIALLPDGNIIIVSDRLNPSGADATTENNCLGRVLLECYMQILYYRHIEKPINIIKIASFKQNTRYLGDDRIACANDYEPGYLEFYGCNLALTGVKVKTLVLTEGPVGAEFAGFTMRPSHWDHSFIVPHYKQDKILAGLYVSHDKSIDITDTRLTAFAFLLYPQYGAFCTIKPIAIAFLQQHLEREHAQMAITFWTDESYLQQMWSGREAIDPRVMSAVLGILREYVCGNTCAQESSGDPESAH